jgi:hypothetical protein
LRDEDVLGREACFFPCVLSIRGECGLFSLWSAMSAWSGKRSFLGVVALLRPFRDEGSFLALGVVALLRSLRNEGSFLGVRLSLTAAFCAFFSIRGVDCFWWSSAWNGRPKDLTSWLGNFLC